jgi:hypothetical protein
MVFLSGIESRVFCFCFISILWLEIQISEWDDWFTTSHLCLIRVGWLVYHVTSLSYQSGMTGFPRHIFVLSEWNDWLTRSHYCLIGVGWLIYHVTCLSYQSGMTGLSRHIFCLAKAKSCIFNVICRGLFCVQLFVIGGGCSFCSYWLKCWPSFIKLSFHNR